MSITGMFFCFLFLPLSLGIYHISNDSIKEYLLLFISIVFYALGSIDYVILFVISMVITVVFGRIMAKTEKKIVKRILLILGIIFNVGLLFYFKYINFTISTWAQITGKEFQLREMLLPLGISFYTFKSISYLADIYNAKAVLADNIAHDFLYLSFFSQIQSGPITRYNDSKRSDSPMIDNFSDGAIRFMIGFNKKVLIANVLANITNEVFNTPFSSFSTAYAWLGSICYSLQLFFDFAGYSDMAIGITEMFGYSCKENFNYPYMTESVSKFWRRWHISLSEWFRDYVYIPMGGSRKKNKTRVYLNLLVVWLLTGIWHGAAWNFIFWGLGYFVLIAFEKAIGLPDRIGSKIGKVLYRIFTLLFINFQWVMFNSKSIIAGLRFIKRMIIYQNNDLANIRVLFLLKDYAFFIVLAIVLSFPIIPWLSDKLKNKAAYRVFEVVEYSLILLAFVWAISFVVTGQNNPFAYANF